MYYIISKFDLDFWKTVHVPFIEKSQNRDSHTFWMSDMGHKIDKEAPIAIKNVKDKKSLMYDIAMDVAFMSLCYNCPLYIYVLKDGYYYKELDIGFVSLRNFGKVSELTDRSNGGDTTAKELLIPVDDTYYKGKVEDIQDAFKKTFSNVSFKSQKVFGYKLTKEEGLKEIENS